MTNGKLLSLLSLLLVAPGCATGGSVAENEKFALYEAHAGEPVDSFRYHGRIDGWTPLGDGAVALWTRPSEAWLVEFQGSCPDIAFAQAITVTDQLGRVSARFDKVIPLGPGGTRIPCVIRQIRPLDVKAVKAAEKQARDGQEAPSGT